MRTINQIGHLDRQKFRSDGDCRQRVVEQILSTLQSLPFQPNRISEMADSLANVVLDAVAKEVPPPPRRIHKLGWYESAETAAAFKVAWDAREDARRFMHIKRDKPRERR